MSTMSIYSHDHTSISTEDCSKLKALWTFLLLMNTCMQHTLSPVASNIGWLNSIDLIAYILCFSSLYIITLSLLYYAIIIVNIISAENDWIIEVKVLV